MNKTRFTARELKTLPRWAQLKIRRKKMPKWTQHTLEKVYARLENIETCVGIDAG